jgi:hypothetical protein
VEYPQLSGIQYHDYVLMVASLDAEWTREQGAARQAIRNSFAQFKHTCWSYRRRLVINHKNWSKARGQPPQVLDSSLFKTQDWVPCGHSDALCFALVDELEAVQTVVETYPKTVEELTVAFCPKVEQFTDDLPQETRKHFIDPHVWVHSRGLAEQAPLLHFARLKIQGLLTLGRALPILEVVYREFARRITAAIGILREADNPIVTPQDLASLRICLLDLQEEEEVGVLFFCSNLSVPMSILSYLQATTVGELLERWPSLCAHLEATNHFQAVIKFYKKHCDVTPRLEDGIGLLQAVANSHVLRWSRSTIAFTATFLKAKPPSDPDSKALPAWSAINGWCEPTVAVNHPPGHQHDLEALLKDVGECIAAADQQQQDHRHCSVPAAESFRLHVAGTTDYYAPLAECFRSLQARESHVIHSNRGLLPTKAFIEAWVNLPDKMRDRATRRPAGGRDMSGWSTTMAIPVPVIPLEGEAGDIFHRTVADTHRALIKTVLETLRKATFLTENTRSVNTGRTYTLESKPTWPICLSELATKIRLAGVPFETRRTLTVLFENFASILGSPLSFDIVLDLYDVIVTLYQMLVDLPPGWTQEDARGLDHPSGFTRRMPDTVVDGLTALIEAIDSALELRQRRLYPESRIRDWALDFRSNILQIILSAEAALKCAAGIHRKFVLNSEDVVADFGVVHQVTFASNITVQRNAFGEPKAPEPGEPPSFQAGTYPVPGRRLAHLRSGVAHLTQLTGYSDLFHELAHVIFDHALSGDVKKHIRQNFSDPIVQRRHMLQAANPEEMRAQVEATFERTTEVFVQLFLMVFVFDGEWKLALQSYAASYSTNIRSAAPNSKHEALLRFALHFAPCLVAAMLVNHAQQTSLSNPDHWWKADMGPRNSPTLDEAKSFFQSALETLKPWLADYHWILPDTDTHEWLWARLQRAYLNVHDYLAALWFKLRDIHWAYVAYVVTAHSGSSTTSSSKPAQPARSADPATIAKFRAIATELDQDLSKITDDSLSHFVPSCGITDMHNGRCIDAALLACRTLLAYWKLVLKEEVGCHHVLHRSFSQGSVEWPSSPGSKPASILLDRTGVAFFCCDYQRRRHLTGVRISLFKTFWNIASRNRGRRLRTLMDQTDAILAVTPRP